MSLISSIIAQIKQETLLFDSKDCLLNFLPNNIFDSPLITEAGDIFYEKWLHSKRALPLEFFFKESASFSKQQKDIALESFMRALQYKESDFAVTDLYLVLGFFKWDGNALAPSLLIPLNVQNKNVTLKDCMPIENVILRERLKDVVKLPSVEEAVINGKFSQQLYFSLFEKAISSERNWNFSRNGFCLSFFNTERLFFKKRMQVGFSDKKINGNAVLQTLLNSEGFKIQDSSVEDFDKNFSPADHNFIYVTDSHTSKVCAEAQNATCAYAIQALPGTKKNEVVSNIIADAVIKKENVLAIYKRAVTKQNLLNVLNAYAPKTKERNDLAKEVRNMRNELYDYYATINKPIAPTGVLFTDLLEEFLKSKVPQKKIDESILAELSTIKFQEFIKLKNSIKQLNELYFKNGGIGARKVFQGAFVPKLLPNVKQELANELVCAVKFATELDPLIAIMQKAGIFTTGIFLSGLQDVLKIILENFDDTTPVFKNWKLRSQNWDIYKDTLIALPEASDQWVRYRKQTSDIYTDDAIDKNILSAREDFVECQNITLKGLSERYRASRKKLLSVLRHPKTVESDAQLLDLIDTLLELQANKKAYKESAMLGNHLFGDDWHFEGSNWIELKQKIDFIYKFRNTHKDSKNLELLLRILEQWHLFKGMFSQLSNLSKCIDKVLISIRHINKGLQLETPLESLCIEKWLDKIKLWSKNWENLDVHLQITSLFKNIENCSCKNLIEYVKDPNNADTELLDVITYYWSHLQMQTVTKSHKELFALTPKERAKKSKDYSNLLDDFCNANRACLQSQLKNFPETFTCISFSESFALNESKQFDVAIILDAECISLAESLPVILAAKKIILVGNPQNAIPEYLPLDAFSEQNFPRTVFFQESILTASLRQGIPTRELWFTDMYQNVSITSFANKFVYNGSIKQFSEPNVENYSYANVNVVADKLNSIVQAAIAHAKHHPENSLGIVAFKQSSCVKIENAIRKQLQLGTQEALFFSDNNINARFFVKTPDRAVDEYRDVIFIYFEPESILGNQSNRKIAICTTLSKKNVQIFITETDSQKRESQKKSLFDDWISYINVKENYKPVANSATSILQNAVMQVMQTESVTIQAHLNCGGISVGPVFVDKNNPKHFLATIEDDCTTERFRETVEDRDYFRPAILKQLGWKIMRMWLPIWFVATKDEISHIIATVAIEQSVAPLPKQNLVDNVELKNKEQKISTVLYTVLHPKIEGTLHDKPITELPTAALITQLKFYVDSESPIHEQLLKQRILELHHVDREGPMLQQALALAIEQGLQKKRFIKTGPFFYSLKSKELVARNRINRPDAERKLSFVAPEERALIPNTMSEHELKQIMGLLE